MHAWAKRLFCDISRGEIEFVMKQCGGCVLRQGEVMGVNKARTTASGGLSSNSSLVDEGRLASQDSLTNLVDKKHDFRIGNLDSTGQMHPGMVDKEIVQQAGSPSNLKLGKGGSSSKRVPKYTPGRHDHSGGLVYGGEELGQEPAMGPPPTIKNTNLASEQLQQHHVEKSKVDMSALSKPATPWGLDYDIDGIEVIGENVKKGGFEGDRTSSKVLKTSSSAKHGSGSLDTGKSGGNSAIRTIQNPVYQLNESEVELRRQATSRGLNLDTNGIEVKPVGKSGSFGGKSTPRSTAKRGTGEIDGGILDGKAARISTPGPSLGSNVMQVKHKEGELSGKGEVARKSGNCQTPAYIIDYHLLPSNYPQSASLIHEATSSNLPPPDNFNDYDEETRLRQFFRAQCRLLMGRDMADGHGVSPLDRPMVDPWTIYAEICDIAGKFGLKKMADLLFSEEKAQQAYETNEDLNVNFMKWSDRDDWKRLCNKWGGMYWKLWSLYRPQIRELMAGGGEASAGGATAGTGHAESDIGNNHRESTTNVNLGGGSHSGEGLRSSGPTSFPGTTGGKLEGGATDAEEFTRSGLEVNGRTTNDSKYRGTGEHDRQHSMPGGNSNSSLNASQRENHERAQKRKGAEQISKEEGTTKKRRMEKSGTRDVDNDMGGDGFEEDRDERDVEMGGWD